jgi:hypothetical protein
MEVWGTVHTQSQSVQGTTVPEGRTHTVPVPASDFVARPLGLGHAATLRTPSDNNDNNDNNKGNPAAAFGGK